MQCFSLVAERRFLCVPRAQYGNINLIVPEVYPKSTKGIRVSRSHACIYLDDKVKVDVSAALLNCQAPDVVIQEEDTVLILQASATRGTKGEITLVPEANSTEYGAIALLDPGRGMHASSRFAQDEPEIVARGKRRVDLLTTEEVALAIFPGFRPVACHRSERRWLVFGQELIRETLQIRYNGYDISYELPAAKDGQSKDPLGR